MKNYYNDSNSNKYQIVTEIKAGAVSGLSYLYYLYLSENIKFSMKNIYVKIIRLLTSLYLSVLLKWALPLAFSWKLLDILRTVTSKII